MALLLFSLSFAFKVNLSLMIMVLRDENKINAKIKNSPLTEAI
jgi:hypothetical protein